MKKVMYLLFIFTWIVTIYKTDGSGQTWVNEYRSNTFNKPYINDNYLRINESNSKTIFIPLDKKVIKIEIREIKE